MQTVFMKMPLATISTVIKRFNDAYENKGMNTLHTYIKKGMLSHSGRVSDQTGASLIEVLVAVLVLSLGMLGMASLQTRGMQFNTSAYYQSQANVLAKDILDRMRASNFNNATVKQFLHSMGDSVPGSYTSCYTKNATCTPSQLAKFELYSWLNDVAAILPSGKASIAEDATGTTPVYIVTVQYDDEKAEASSNYGQNNAIAARQIIYRTEL